VDTVLNWLARYELLPSRRLVVQVFEALAVDNDLHGALAFISRLSRAKYYVSGFTYSLLIDALTKHQNSEGAMFVFLHMERARFAPHTATFNKLIQSFARLGDYTTSYRLLQDMQRHGLSPDNTTFAALIAACAQGGRMDLALQMFDYFRKFHSRLTRAKHTHKIKDIKLLQSARAAAAASASSSDPSSSVVPHDTRELVPLTLGPAPFEALILAHLARGELHESVARLNEMVALSVQPSRRIYASLINFCVDANRNSEAKQLWEQALEIGVVPNVSLYTAYMRTLTALADLQHLYAEMTQGGDAHPHADQHALPAEDAAAKQRVTVAAAENGGVVVSAPGSFHGPLLPSAYVFAQLLAAMLREGRVEQLGWLVAEMRSARVLPNRPMRVLMRALLHKAGRVVEARLFWRLVHTRSADALDDAMIELLVKGSDEAQARALLAELDAEWQANRERAARSQQQDTELEPSDESAVEEEAAALAEAQHAAPVQAAEYVSEYTEPTAADFPQGVRLPPQEEEVQEGKARRE
jgi:pentatricopeptide repeat protein